MIALSQSGQPILVRFARPVAQFPAAILILFSIIYQLPPRVARSGLCKPGFDDARSSELALALSLGRHTELVLYGVYHEGNTVNLHQVCAVVVTYHPNANMVANMSAVRAQVQGMVVVDNGSEPEELAPLRQAASEIDFELFENGDNLGVAEALNRGVAWAKEQGFSWVVLFDQDSQITTGFLDAMFETWEAHPLREKIASLHPRHVEPGSNLESAIRRAPDGGPIVSITSGALMPVWIFDRIGYFASEYFIDEVDTEYCLRIRAAGYILVDSRDVILFHAVGQPRYASLLGFRFRPSHHHAIRRYYMSRNRIVVFRKYVLIFPGWMLQGMYRSVKDIAKVLIGEEDRAHKLRNFLLGTWDGLTGRMGKRTGI